MKKSLGWLLPLWITFSVPIALSAQCVTPSNSYPAACATGCSGGQQEDFSYDFSGNNTSVPTNETITCTPTYPGAVCNNVSYVVLNDAPGICGSCPDCGNPNCTASFQYNGCCDSDSECQPGGVCGSCAQRSCGQPASAGYQCCADSDCMSGLSCAGGSCTDCTDPCASTECPNYSSCNDGEDCTPDGDPCDINGCEYNVYVCEGGGDGGDCGYCNSVPVRPVGPVSDADPNVVPRIAAPRTIDPAHPISRRSPLRPSPRWPVAPGGVVDSPSLTLSVASPRNL